MFSRLIPKKLEEVECSSIYNRDESIILDVIRAVLKLRHIPYDEIDGNFIIPTIYEEDIQDLDLYVCEYKGGIL